MSVPAHEELVQLRGIVKRFPGVVALRGVHLEVTTSEIHALVGENGAGKSTLIKVLSGVYSQDAGEIYVHGKPVTIKDTSQAQTLGITTIYQELHLAPHLNTFQNVFLGRELHHGVRLDDKAMEQRVAPLAEEFGLSLRDLGRPVEELGGLEKRVVMLLRALVFRAELIIMDELTAGLADKEREALFNHMKALRSQGISVLWVTHRLEELVGRADRATVLRDGRYVGTVRVDPSGANLDEIVKMMIGREIASHEELLAKEVAERVKTPRTECVLRVEGLNSGRKLHDIEFNLHRGEILGVAGMAGSGRTELARAIMGADKRDSGSIEIEGKQTKIRSPRDAYRNGISLVPEERKTLAVFGDFTVIENITVAALWKVLTAGFVLRKKQEASVAEHYREDLDIRTSTLRRALAFLSGGNQQKVILARSLFADPAVMILDEPTQGIDVAAKLEVYRLVNAFVQGGGSAIIVCSELPELVAVSDRIMVMREGHIVTELAGKTHGTKEEKIALEETIIAYATGARTADGQHEH